MELLISISGACTAILVSIISALLSNRNSNAFQIRKLKEEHYISYIESLHNLASAQSRELDEKIIDDYVTKFTFFRDKLLIVGSEAVVKEILAYEKNVFVKHQAKLHDKYLSNVIRAIRKDLKIRDRNFPEISFKK